MTETLARNNLPEANVRIVVTGGPSPDFMTPQDRPRLLVLVSPAPQLPAGHAPKTVRTEACLHNT